MKSIELAKLWHLRLGHLPFSQMKILFPNIDVNKVHESTICTIFPIARQTRKTFFSSFIKTTKSFQLIHIDVWGPYKYVTHDGYRFFLTIVDDLSRATWIYLMKSKDESISFIKQFYAYVETQFQTHISLKAFFTKNLALILPNKMRSLNENIVNFLRLLAPYPSNPTFLHDFGASVLR